MCAMWHSATRTTAHGKRHTVSVLLVGHSLGTRRGRGSWQARLHNDRHDACHDACHDARHDASMRAMRVTNMAGDYPVNGEIYGTAFSQWVDGMRAEFPDVQYGAVGLWTPNDGLQTQHAPPDGAAGLGVGVIANWMEDMLSKTDAVRKADWLAIHDYFDKEATVLSSTQLLNRTSQLHRMPDGVADFIRRASPTTPMRPLALTEFNIATTYSASSNATARLVDALFLGTIIAQTLNLAPVAALTEFGWHARWNEHAATGQMPPRSGSYGMVTFGAPSWAPDVPSGTPLPKFYAQLLAKLVTGATILTSSLTVADHSTDRSKDTVGSSIEVLATEFNTGEVGLFLVNTALQPLRLSVQGLSGTGSRAARYASGVIANAWVLEANATTVVPALGARSLLDAPAVLINGVGNGQLLGGPWPIGNRTIPPYTVATASAGEPLLVDLPAASIVALVLHGARPPAPSPPPLPPFPPPSPPPPCYTGKYQDCLESHCCVDAKRFGCYKRPTLRYAQCRPLGHRPCQDTSSWLCPGWWENTSSAASA